MCVYDLPDWPESITVQQAARFSKPELSKHVGPSRHQKMNSSETQISCNVELALIVDCEKSMPYMRVLCHAES